MPLYVLSYHIYIPYIQLLLQDVGQVHTPLLRALAGKSRAGLYPEGPVPEGQARNPTQ